jgi:hypothetical protein
MIMPPIRSYPCAASLGLLLIALILIGCGEQSNTPPQVVPTISSMFGTQPTIRPVPTLDSSTDNSTVPQPLPNATAIAQATITALGEDKLLSVPIYSDTLSASWSIKNSFQTTIDLKSQDYINQGHFAIKVQPQMATGTLYFTLDKTVTKYILRNRVQALRFYVSGGKDYLDKDAITVAIIGSNAHPYWIENDTSVKIDGRVTDNQPVFSETRLSFLGIHKSIPPKTYVKVTVWLNDLIYDPIYTYVTGFYVKTDKISAPTFYIDDVSLLMQPNSL